MSSKAPSAPRYQSPGAPTVPAAYVAPTQTTSTQATATPYASPTYVAPPNPAAEVPATFNYGQVMAKSANVEKYLPSWLQLGTTNPMDTTSPQFQQAEQNYYTQNVAPQVAADEANLNSGGQDYGSYAGALVGSDVASGKLAAYNAGLNYDQTAFNAQTAGRNEYFGQNANLVQTQNQNSINNALQVAGLQTTQAQNQNNFNLTNANQAASSSTANTANANNYLLTNAANQNQYSLNSTANQNAYSLSTAQQLNNYQLQAAQGKNTFNSGIYGSQAGMYDSQLSAVAPNTYAYGKLTGAIK